MSKSILQEIATLNAEEFNNNQLKISITQYKEDVAKNEELSAQLNYNLENAYKLQIVDLFEKTSNSNELLKADMFQMDININTLSKFLTSKLAYFYHSTGSMKKEYTRLDIIQGWLIDKQQFKKLSYYTGPVSSEVLDPISGLHSSYTTPLPETSWTWLYVDAATNKYLKYGSYNVISVNNNIITLGDATHSVTTAAGDLNVTTNLDVLGGWLHINTPNAGIVPDSINVNGHINSSFGWLKVQEGMFTVQGDITTGGGGVQCTSHILTTGGNITTNLGNISADAGKIDAWLGYTTNTGGYVCLTSGDFITPNGLSSVTLGYTTNTVGYDCTLSGNFTTANGNFITQFGNFQTVAGDIISDIGDLNIFNGDGYISGLLTVGDLLVQGDSNFNGDVDLADATKLDVDFLNVRSELRIGGLIGSIASFDAGGIDLKTNVAITGTLDVSSTSTFIGTITARDEVLVTNDVRARAMYVTDKFYGTATSAEYADLAEKYTSDDDYAPGTVLSIGGSKEVTLYDPDLPLAGVVSSDPGYLMNAKIEGVEIALKGRIPVKTNMSISRGMYICPDPLHRGFCIGLTKQEFNSRDLELIGICINKSIDGFVEVKV